MTVSTPTFLSVGDGTVLSVSSSVLLAVGYTVTLGNPIEPPFNEDTAWSWPINGQTVQFANYDPLTLELLVIFVDGTYQLLTNIPLFNSNSATEANVLALLASQGF